MVSNFRTPTEKDSKFLDYHNKPIKRREKSYTKDSSRFISKIKDLENIPEGAILVTADVLSLYPSILHEAGLNAIGEALGNKENKHIPTDNLLEMVEFVLKNNYFELNSKIKKQLLGTTIGTKSAPAFASILLINFRVVF